MRSRANFSASSVGASQALHRGIDLGGVTRSPAASRSSRSNLRVASISAASPRAATSSTMARVAASMSAETSRFVGEKAREALGEIGAAAVEANGHGGFPGGILAKPTAQWRGDKSPSTLCLARLMRWRVGLGVSSPGGFASSPRSLVAEIVGAEIGQLAFQAFDIEPQRPAMAEQQHRAAAGRLAG